MKKSILRVVSIILSMLFILVLIPRTEVKSDVISAYGICGDHLTYHLYRDPKKLTISGTGPMWDDYTPWFKTSQSAYVTDVIVEEGVTHIGKNAFNPLPELESVTLPYSLKSIGESAFENCSNLKTVILPYTLKEIAPKTFKGCSNLEYIYVPDSVTKIGNEAFNKVDNALIEINAREVTFEGALETKSEFLIHKDLKNYLNELGIEDNKLHFYFDAFINLPNGYTLIREFSYRTQTTKVNIEDVPDYYDVSATWYQNFKSEKLQTEVVDNGKSLIIKLPDTFEDMSVTIQLTLSYKQKTVTFMSDDGKTTYQSGSVNVKSVPSYTGIVPTKDLGNQYFYKFIGWQYGDDFYDWKATLPAVGDSDMDFYAVFEECLNSYNVKFLNEDGTELQSEWITYGEMPSYHEETPTKEKTDEFNYTFAGWSPEITTVTGTATYTATYTREINKYEIKFVNEDGTELQSEMVEYGQTPTYNGETPTKEKTDEFNYTFAGWSPEITSVTGTATYIATYTEDINEYEVKFVNEDGTELQSEVLEYGLTPTYSGETPTKKEDDKYTYTFDGWTPEIKEVTGDATYTAKFSANMKVAPPTVVPEPTPNPEVIASFEAFVERLYEVALGRESDPDGKAYWAGQVIKGNLTGADCIRAFLLSEEFSNRNLSDEEFVTVLYKALFDRDAANDPEGFNFWMNSLKTVGRENVVDGFINSTEWCNVCASYGVKSGATRAKATIASKNATEFATRLYTECLGREPDAEGLAFWSLALTNLDITGTEAAHEFFYSAEFNGFNLSNTELVTKMYKTLLGRDADSDGLSFWVGNMDNGMTKDQLFENFSTSPEFTGICVNYAIDR